MKLGLMAELKALPKNWRKKAEKTSLTGEEIGEKAGVYDSTCPQSERPTLLIITEDNEVFRLSDQGAITWLSRQA